MEYSISQLSKLSGVSPRTLRWYDKIDLLTPSRIGENGYRYYGTGQVDRLQDILLYRALGVRLAEIQTILDNPSFCRLTALRSHLAALEGEMGKINALIESVRQTIQAQERDEKMDDEVKFRAFVQETVKENEEKYGTELREKYGEGAVDRANEAMGNLSPEQYRQLKQLEAQILEGLEHAVQQGSSPTGQAGRQITALHRQWLSISWGSYDVQWHIGVAQMYVMDSRFIAYYDKRCPGCAEFLQSAVSHWADRLE